MKETKTVSLADELTGISRAAAAVQLLLDQAREKHGDGDEVLAAASGALSLVVSRLVQVRSAVRGTLDPIHLWAAHNSTTPSPLSGEDPDVRLWERGKTRYAKR